MSNLNENNAIKVKSDLIKMNLRKRIVAAIGLGIILQWISLVLSYQKLSDVYSDASRPFAIGGFPFKSFEYPAPALGADWPPSDTWLMFGLNLLSWIIFSFAISFVLGTKIEDKRIIKAILFFAISSSLIGIFYIMLNFD